MSDLVNCQKCHNRMKVMESRQIILDGVLTVWRRRVCAGCSTTTRTVEVETVITDWTAYG